MHNTKNLIIKINKINLRNFSKCCVRNVAAETTQTPSNEILSIPVPEGINQPPNPKLLNIVNDISQLNLLEVSELSKLLKKTLNLPDAPMMMGSFGGSFSTNKSAAAEDEEEQAPKKVQTSFKVKLMKFDEKQKVPLIKEIKNLLEGMNLVQAKKFVESAPTTVKDDVSKDESTKLKEALEKVGATIEIE